MKNIALLSALLLSAAPFALASDTVLINGHIYTASPNAKWAQAVSVSGDQVDSVGSNEAALKTRTTHTKVIDLHGKTVIPGITDGHVHLWFGALALHGFNLQTPEVNITPKEPALLESKIKAYASSHPSEPVVYGRAQFITDFSATGFKRPALPGGLLDRAVPNRPLVIHDFSEHALWVNSRTLKLANITDKPLSDPSLEHNIQRDAQGHPTGLVLEGAMELVEQALPEPPLEQKMAWLQKAQHYLNSFGVTSATMATGSLADIELYGKMRDRGLLTIRTRTSFGAVAVNHHLTPKFLSDLETARSNYHDKWVSANLVKFFSDGLTDPPLYTPEEYSKIVLELDKRKYQIMTHSLGIDSARMVLDTYAKAEKVNGPRDRRFRMEHADFLTSGELAQFHPLSVIASMQPSFCCFSESIPGVEYDAWGSMLQSGAALTFSSDWPCTWPPSPMAGIQEAVLRETQPAVTSKGPVAPKKALGGKNTLTAEQAVIAYTRTAAYSNFAEKQMGTIEPGKFADLVVLSQDVFTAKPETIGKTQVAMTMVGGKIVFEPGKD